MAKKITPEQAQKVLARLELQPFEIESYLYPQQLRLVTDPSRFKTAVTTRQAGKTTACAADLLNTALAHSNSVCLYITLSRGNAKRLVWRALKHIDKKFNLGCTFNESDLLVTTTNGSIVYLSGASDRTEIEKFRGLALTKVYIDEGQSFPPYISDLIDDVLGPALMAHSGSLILIGTPGPIPAGYFYECSQSPNWSHHFWSFQDNLSIKDHKKVLQDELTRRGLLATSPSIRREWFGEWLLDSNSLVFKYDNTLQDYQELPPLTHYIMGVDLGFDDADAIVILGWSEADYVTYLVTEKITTQQGLTPLMSQIDELQKQYGCYKIVVDQGGLGKKLAESMTERYGQMVVAAEKHRKNEFIELMNDALRTGRLKAKVGSRFEHDCKMVEWDKDKTTPDKRVVSDRFHSDVCDAVLYAWRESYSFTHVPSIPKPKPGTPEHIKAFEQALVENYEANAMKAKEENMGWELGEGGIPPWNKWEK
jgi:hypothetical protein